MLINCPLCGNRPNSEFTILGELKTSRPDFENSAAGEWHDYVYLRDNPKGNTTEHWQHTSGCRSWLLVERNNVTHKVLSVTLSQDADAKGAVK